MTLSTDTARCTGAPAGPSGHQNRPDCLHCQRRTAPRPAGMTTFIDPPQQFPCAQRIAPEPCGRFG